MFFICVYDYIILYITTIFIYYLYIEYNKMVNEYETWYSHIRKVGGSYMVLIPLKVVEFAGYKEGDTLKLMSKKNEDQV